MFTNRSLKSPKSHSIPERAGSWLGLPHDPDRPSEGCRHWSERRLMAASRLTLRPHLLKNRRCGRTYAIDPCEIGKNDTERANRRPLPLYVRAECVRIRESPEQSPSRSGQCSTLSGAPTGNRGFSTVEKRTITPAPSRSRSRCGGPLFLRPGGPDRRPRILPRWRPRPSAPHTARRPSGSRQSTRRRHR